MSLTIDFTKTAEVDLGTVGKDLVGGAVVGGGVSALGLYLRHLNDVQERAKVRERRGKMRTRQMAYDPNAPEIKEATADPVNSTGTFMAGTAATGLGAYGAWKLVKHIYQAQQAAAAKKELEDATNQYIGGLRQERQLKKTAGDQFGPWTTAKGVTGLALLLTALGSGVAAHHVLTKRDPNFKPKPRERDELDPLPVPSTKIASADRLPEKALEAEMLEGLLRLSLEDKRAAQRDSSLSDLVAAAAAGRTEELRQLVNDVGVDGMFEVVKGARHVKSSASQKALAMAWLVRDPLLGTAIAPVVAAEYADSCPTYLKLACHVPEDFVEPLKRLFASSATVGRLAEAEYLVKQSSQEVVDLLRRPDIAGPRFLQALLEPGE